MSLSSAVVSFFTYFQNLSVNIKLPHINFPDWFLILLKAVNEFISRIQYYILQIPPFDMRTQLILTSVILPFLLEILFVWFVQPLLLTLLSIIDIICIFSLFFFLAYAITVHFSLIITPIIVSLIIYFIVRITLKIKKRPRKVKMTSIARDICNHYLYGLIPELKMEHSLDKLNNTIQQFSKVVEIKPSPHVVSVTVIFFTISSVSFLITFYFFNVYPFLKAPFSRQLNILIGVIFLLISTIFFTVFVLRISQCGRRFIMHFKQFCKRWGLRILMLCFDLLYIPNVSMIISHVNVKRYSPCGSGQYLYQKPDIYGNSFSYLIEHETSCFPCHSNLSALSKNCVELCSGVPKFRPVDDSTLEFFKDIVPYSSGFLVWGLVFVIFGIPILWYYVIWQNRKFAFVINVYGNEPSIKWLKIVNRMRTTGIFLFVNFKYNNSRWSVLYLLVKFLAMMLSTVASRFFKYLSLSLSCLYFLIFFSVVAVRPYLYFFNNLLDSILYFTQFLFSLNSSLAIFDIKVSLLASSILSVIVIVVPILSMVLLLLFKRKSANFENDPTYPQKLSRDEEELLNEKRNRAKENHRLDLNGDYDYEYEEEEENDVFVLNEAESSNRKHLKSDPTSPKSSHRKKKLNHSSARLPTVAEIMQSNDQVNNYDDDSDAFVIDDNENNKKTDLKSPKSSNRKKKVTFNEEDESNQPLLNNKKETADSYRKSDPTSPKSSHRKKKLNRSSAKLPTVAEIMQYKPEQQKQNRRKKKHQTDDVNEDDDINRPLLDVGEEPETDQEEEEEDYESEYETETFELEEFDDDENICYIPEDEYEVHPLDLCSVDECIRLMKKCQNQVYPEDGEKTYVVNKRVLASRMTSMYEMLDVVVDGFTIELITKALNFAIICGMGALGWYIGSIYSNNDIIKPPVCHLV